MNGDKFYMPSISDLVSAINAREKDKIALMIFSLLFLILLFLSAFYFRAISEKYDITPEIVDLLSKEDLKALIEINKRNEALEFIALLSIGLGGFIIGFIVFYLFFKQNQQLSAEHVLLLLKGKEKEFFNILISKGGEAPQFIIRNEMGLSKVKMSRFIEKLEKDGLINVDRSSRVNIIRLDEKILRKCKEMGIIK